MGMPIGNPSFSAIFLKWSDSAARASSSMSEVKPSRLGILQNIFSRRHGGAVGERSYRGMHCPDSRFNSLQIRQRSKSCASLALKLNRYTLTILLKCGHELACVFRR